MMAKKNNDNIVAAKKRVEDTRLIYHNLNTENRGKPYSQAVQTKLLEALENKRSAVSDLAVLRKGGKLKTETKSEVRES